MKKKISAVWLLAGVLALAGCGDKAATNSSLVDTGGSETSSDTVSTEAAADVVNGGFETGDLSGWTVNGTAFTADDVTDVASFADGVTPDKVGEKYYAGATGSLPSFIGSMVSAPFELGGLGFVCFILGAIMEM